MNLSRNTIDMFAACPTGRRAPRVRAARRAGPPAGAGRAPAAATRAAGARAAAAAAASALAHGRLSVAASSTICADSFYLLRYWCLINITRIVNVNNSCKYLKRAVPTQRPARAGPQYYVKID